MNKNYINEIILKSINNADISPSDKADCLYRFSQLLKKEASKDAIITCPNPTEEKMSVRGLIQKLEMINNKEQPLNIAIQDGFWTGQYLLLEEGFIICESSLKEGSVSLAAKNSQVCFMPPDEVKKINNLNTEVTGLVKNVEGSIKKIKSLL